MTTLPEAWRRALPAGWDWTRLKYVSAVGTGHTPDRAKPEYWVDCSIPWVTAADLSQRASAFEPLLDTAQHVSELGVANSAAVVHPPGTVMFCRTASVGLFCITGTPMATTQAFVTWTAGDRLDQRYLLYAIAAMKSEFDRLAYGSTHLTIYMPDLEALDVPVPPVDEQRRIASFLDDQVSRIDRMIVARYAQRASIRSLLQQSIDSVAAAPEAPRVRTSRVARVLPGWSFPSDGFTHNSDDVRLLRGTNVGLGSTRWDDVVYWPAAQGRSLEQFQLREGDVVLGMDRPWIGGGMRIALITPADLPALLVQRVAKFIPSPAVRSEFLFWMFRATDFRRGVEAELTGLSVPHLSGEQIGSHKIPSLSLEEQDRVIADLKDREHEVRRSIEVLGRSVDLLAEYKQALIASAVTGEFDVTAAASSRRLPV